MPVWAVLRLFKRKSQQQKDVKPQENQEDPSLLMPNCSNPKAPGFWTLWMKAVLPKKRPALPEPDARPAITSAFALDSNKSLVSGLFDASSSLSPSSSISRSSDVSSRRRSSLDLGRNRSCFETSRGSLDIFPEDQDMLEFEDVQLEQTSPSQLSKALSIKCKSYNKNQSIGSAKEVTRLVQAHLAKSFKERPEAVPDTWEVDVSALQLYKDKHGKPVELGHGTAGTVYKGRYFGVQDVAVKTVNHQNDGVIDADAQAHFISEIAILQKMKCPHIILYMGAGVQDGRTILLMEYMQHGTLWEALRRNPASFDWYHMGQKVLMDIAKGLAYLHWNDCLHLDVKSHNVLLNEFDKAVVADIGLGKVMADCDNSIKASGHTALWSSPEQKQGRPCSKASDVYSFGVILWEVCSREPMHGGTRRYLRHPRECPESIAILAEACCSEDAVDRPTMQQVCSIMERQSALGTCKKLQVCRQHTV